MSKKTQDTDIDEVVGNDESTQAAGIDEWKNKYLRALADYQNLEKRSQQEQVRTRAYAAEQVLRRILPVIDTFERAQKHLKDAGLELAIRELRVVLEEQGVVKIDVMSKQFDPHHMDCIEVVEGKKDNIVVEVIEDGFMLHDKVLRVAKVKVSKKGNTNKKS